MPLLKKLENAVATAAVRPRFIIIMCITGLAAGVSAFLLKGGIRLLADLVHCHLGSEGPQWPLLLLPAAGVLLAVLYQKYISRSSLESGTGQVKAHISAHNPQMKPNLMVSPLIANIFTLGLGGSAGAEGPIAFSSAAVASNLGRRFNMPPRLMATIIGCGAGAGIAAIFKAPIGGVLFALEVVGLPVTTPVVLGLILTCLIAGLTSFVLGGSVYPFVFTPSHLFHVDWLPALLLLGLFCGVYSWYYSRTSDFTASFLAQRKNVWLRGGASALWMGALLFLFPAVYGEGFGVVNGLLNGDTHSLTALSPLEGMGHVAVIAVLGGILLCKGSLTSATNHGGGVGGSFAPTLFAGCIAGMFFATVLAGVPWLNAPLHEFTFIAMCGVMAGVIRAPFMAMFLAPEMSGNFHLFLPCVIVALVSWTIACALEKDWRVKGR